jgi:hypothetical protein
LAKGGYIIKINPIARGIDVVPTEREEIQLVQPGNQAPKARPSAMARTIQRVSQRSKNDKCFMGKLYS